MVVGAKQTSSATIFVRLTGSPCPARSTENFEKGKRQALTTKKIMVKVMSSICSAISLGVFLRLAPSTMAIILSKKLLPASAVTRMMSQSLVIVVPPVTALLSPPDSRMTGADSPVMALSSTLATPTITSPSMGICSPALTSTISPARS